MIASAISQEELGFPPLEELGGLDEVGSVAQQFDFLAPVSRDVESVCSLVLVVARIRSVWRLATHEDRTRAFALSPSGTSLRREFGSRPEGSL